MNIAILGGGFGLYGYLPALLQIPHLTPMLPARYQERIQTRDDIKHLYNFIQWVKDEDSLLESCEGIIIALPPTQQYMWAKKCLNIKSISHIFLEKPLASSPDLADDLLNNLENSGKKFRLGYNFRYTDWGENILRCQQGLESISWHFKAHHYAHNIRTWKRQHEEGGGALRFYGIHLIALLAELGYSDAIYSELNARHKSEVEMWEAEIIGAGLPPCKVIVNSNSEETGFIVHSNKGHDYSLLHPFQTAQQQSKKGDQRIPFLLEGLYNLFGDTELFYNWYSKANLLWANIEKRSLVL